METKDPNYPRMDDRFQRMTEEYSLDDCLAWCSEFPPEPVMEQGEDYAVFVQRQTFYAQYRNGIVGRRDSLKDKERQLSLPKAPVGEDIAAAIEWITETGETPIEYLVKAYRSPGNKTEHRIAAASKVMEYVHRKLPATFDISKITPEEVEKMASTVRQVEKVLADRMREQKKVKGAVAGGE